MLHCTALHAPALRSSYKTSLVSNVWLVIVILGRGGRGVDLDIDQGTGKGMALP